VRLPALVEPAALLTVEEVRRYSRHLIIPDVGMTGQRRLKNAKVLCIGAGGLGSPAMMYLAAAGVGTLGIVDFDTVDVSNLQRQVIHGQSDIGRSKAVSARDRLREINSLRIIGTAKDKGPVISFEMKGAHPHDVATVIDRGGIAVRAGTHCVMPLLERFNVTATCRASFGMYNTRAEVDQLAQALIKARELFS